MKFLILSEGSKKIGFGHITRSIAIAQGALKLNHQVELIINGDDSTTALLDSLVKDVIYDNWLINSRNHQYEDYDFVIVDSYLANLDHYNFIKNRTQLVCIDDNNRLNYPCNYLINGSIGANQISYNYSSYTKLLLGTQYTPLRKQFWNSSKKIIKKNITNVLITFGGSDIKELSPFVVKSIISQYPGINITVVVGNGFSNHNKEMLRNYSGIKLINNPSASNMSQLLFSTDLAISAGGQTLYELGKLGVPTIAIQVANNQEFHLCQWINAEIILKKLVWNEVNLDVKLIEQYNKLKNKQLREEISSKAQKLMKENGAVNIIKELTEKN